MESTINVIGCMNLPYKYVKNMNAIFLGESSYFKMPMSKGKKKNTGFIMLINSDQKVVLFYLVTSGLHLNERQTIQFTHYMYII